MDFVRVQKKDSKMAIRLDSEMVPLLSYHRVCHFSFLFFVFCFLFFRIGFEKTQSKENKITRNTRTHKNKKKRKCDKKKMD